MTCRSDKDFFRNTEIFTHNGNREWGESLGQLFGVQVQREGKSGRTKSGITLKISKSSGTMFVEPDVGILGVLSGFDELKRAPQDYQKLADVILRELDPLLSP